jgi:hypothetical protein
MTSYSERRHRLHGDEVPEAIEGLRLRLLQHLKTRENLYAARVAFRAFYRLSTYCRGRPSYPNPVTWDLIDSYLNGTVSREEGA